MTDEENNITPPSDDEVDIEELLNGMLDARGLTAERIQSLDSLGTLGEKIEDLFKQTKKATPAGTKFDEEGFMDKVAKLMDEKIGTLAPVAKKPALSKWLGL